MCIDWQSEVGVQTGGEFTKMGVFSVCTPKLCTPIRSCTPNVD